MLAERVKLLKPSPTLALAAKVNAMKRGGEDIISFTAGEPDFNTPETICEAAAKAARDGKTKYTPTAGITELRDAVAQKLRTENDIESSAEQVVITAGAKQAVFNALMAVCSPGDDVVIIAPYWPTYVDQATLAGAGFKVQRAKKENNYIPDVDELRETLTDNTRALVINSPNNPTGAVIPRDTLKDIAQLALERDFYVISDEIYEKHLYDGAKHVSIASFGPELAHRTVTVGGVSKAFAMTGWRLGWASAPVEVACAMTVIQDQVSSGASSVSQWAALEALRNSQRIVAPLIREFDARRKVLLKELANIDGLSVVPPHGAFYAFVDIGEFLHYRPDIDVAASLLENHKVACMPGSVFEGPGHLRLTYALDKDAIIEGVKRIAEGLRSLD